MALSSQVCLQLKADCVFQAKGHTTAWSDKSDLPLAETLVGHLSFSLALEREVLEVIDLTTTTATIVVIPKASLHDVVYSCVLLVRIPS